MHTSNNFVLRGGDAAFANRQKLLFDQLSIAEDKCNKHDRCEVDDIETYVNTDSLRNKSSTSRDEKRKRETKRFRGRESIFKRPEGRAPHASFRGVPDYHKNPHKWTKYSLGDVSNEDMTEQSNMQAAMSFLRDLKARRKRERTEESDEVDIESCSSSVQDCDKTTFERKKRPSTSQIVFKKPQTKETEEVIVIESDEKPIFRSSKIILPEYVIGQKPKKIPKLIRPVVKGDRLKGLRLDHLEELDKEEDD